MSSSYKEPFLRDLKSGNWLAAKNLLGKELDISVGKWTRKGYSQQHACDLWSKSAIDGYTEALFEWDNLIQRRQPKAG